MAWLDKRGDIYRLVFQIGGQTFKRSLRTSDSREAEGMIALVERRIKMVAVETNELTRILVFGRVEVFAFIIAFTHWSLGKMEVIKTSPSPNELR